MLSISSTSHKELAFLHSEGLGLRTVCDRGPSQLTLKPCHQGWSPKDPRGDWPWEEPGAGLPQAGGSARGLGYAVNIFEEE